MSAVKESIKYLGILTVYNKHRYTAIIHHLRRAKLCHHSAGSARGSRAARDLDIDVAGSYMCGDKAADVECGINAGCRKSFLALTGYGESELSKCPAGTPVCRDFAALVKAIFDDADATTTSEAR